MYVPSGRRQPFKMQHEGQCMCGGTRCQRDADVDLVVVGKNELYALARLVWLCSTARRIAARGRHEHFDSSGCDGWAECMRRSDGDAGAKQIGCKQRSKRKCRYLTMHVDG